jgi:hypothetical protein
VGEWVSGEECSDEAISKPQFFCEVELPQKVNGGLASVSVVPTGLCVIDASIPSDKSLGYYHKSLRDKVFA